MKLLNKMKELILTLNLKYKKMLSYCLSAKKKYKKYRSLKDQLRTTYDKTMLLSNCAICASKQ